MKQPRSTAAEASAFTERDEVRTRIIETAEQQLAEVGAAQLSMRSIARQLGVTVGALYRYFDGRDALLTELISRSYSKLGQVMSRADAVQRQSAASPLQRWIALWSAAYEWAQGHSQQFHLIYGTPVIGYAAPESTVEPASTVIRALLRIVMDAHGGCLHGGAEGHQDETPPASTLIAPDDLARVREWAKREARRGLSPAGTDAGEISAVDVFELIAAWTALIGTISFSLGGHYRGSIENVPFYLRALACDHALRLGLVSDLAVLPAKTTHSSPDDQR